MDPDEFQQPLSADDPLAQMGLVDYRTGRALETENWTPSTSSESVQRSQSPGAAAGSEPASSDVSDDSGEPESEAVDPRTRSTQIDWDSDENPHKQRAARLEAAAKTVPDPAAQARQTFDQTVAQLNAEKPAAIAILTTQGLNGTPIPADMAHALVESIFQGKVAEARLQADRAALMPTAKQAVAADVAKKFSVGGVTIKPEELIDLPSPEAMTAKAEALQQGRRDNAFQQRKASRRDRAEGGGVGIAAATRNADSLSAQGKIALGLRRGDLDRM